MTFLRPTGSQWRTPEMGKSYVVSSYRGITRCQAWPRPRGRARTISESNRRKIFSLWSLLIKWLTHWETAYERQAVADHNRTHTGQRGSAAMRLRDWQTQRLYGRGIAINVSPYLTFWPPAVSRDASFILDHTTAEPGQLLQRQLLSWTEGSPGLAGDVLTAGSSGQPNKWLPIV